MPDASPLFEGHFPGHRVLPAIGQLAIVAALLRLWIGRPVTLTGAGTLRFSRPVIPGQRVKIGLDALPDGESTGFEIRSDGALVSSGKVRFEVERGA